MNLIKDHSKEPSAHIAISTAFRLPIALLGTVDAWCDQNDVTRSQFFRKSIMDRIKALGIECIVPKVCAGGRPRVNDGYMQFYRSVALPVTTAILDMVRDWLRTHRLRPSDRPQSQLATRNTRWPRKLYEGDEGP